MYTSRVNRYDDIAIEKFRTWVAGRDSQNDPDAKVTYNYLPAARHSKKWHKAEFNVWYPRP